MTISTNCMKKKLIFYLLILSSYTNVTAQSDNIFIEFNYNTFFHSSLKSFQDEFVADITEVDVKQNNRFPSNIGLTIGYHLNSINTDLFFGFTNTGGKISYSDYSGTIRLTQPLNGYYLGGIYHIPLVEKDKQHLSLGLKGVIIFSSLNIISYNELLNEITEQEINLNAIDFGGGVSLIYQYPISFVLLRASLGFDLVYGNKLFFSDNKNTFIENNSGKPVRTGWSGVRVGLGIAIPF